MNAPHLSSTPRELPTCSGGSAGTSSEARGPVAGHTFLSAGSASIEGSADASSKVGWGVAV
jgi:hypothetical protein